jgi:hypothetical protein
MSSGWIPDREQDLVDLLAIWDETLNDSAKVTAYGWTSTECAKVKSKIGEFTAARAEYLADKSPTKRLAKDNAKEAIKAAMRYFADRFIRFNDKMTEEEKLAMGIHPKDTTHTPKPDPTDLVEFELSTIPSDHRIIAKYHIAGHQSRGKGTYHAAEICYQVRPLTEAPPPNTEGDGWHSQADTASPWEKSFPDDKGKCLYIAMRWENAATQGDRGKGPWSAIESIVVP